VWGGVHVCVRGVCVYECVCACVWECGGWWCMGMWEGVWGCERVFVCV